MAKASASKPVSRTRKRVQKSVRRIPIGWKVAILLLFAVALAVGAASAYYLTLDDCFTLDSNASLCFQAGETVERAALRCRVTAVSLGRDISDTLTVATTLPDTGGDTLTLTEGVYYTTYTVTTPLGKKIERIQTITVLQPVSDAEGGELGG